MVDVLHPLHHPVEPVVGPALPVRGGSRLAAELRDLAEDMAGRIDRDELTLDEEELLADVIDEAVATVLPAITQALEDALTPRLESLPLHARMTLAGARRRRQFGID
jgi:hypothetical protein